MSFLTAKSFVFNGINSEDYNVVIAWVDSEPDVSTGGLSRETQKSTTSKIKVKDNIYGSDNTEPISFSFNIVRIDGTEITREESIRINQWLTSSPLPQLLQFNDYDSYMLHYYAVCTQIKDIVIGGRLVGKDLTFETNSSFAFAKNISKTFDVTDSLNFHLNNLSDTYNGIYYPTITIITKSDNIIIENITDRKSVTFDMTNIIANENGDKVLKINNEIMSILDADNKLVYVNEIGWGSNYKSYVSSTDSYMTNIYWVRMLKGMNEFKITGTCAFKIECEFPRKAGCL